MGVAQSLIQNPFENDMAGGVSEGGWVVISGKGIRSRDKQVAISWNNCLGQKSIRHYNTWIVVTAVFSISLLRLLSYLLPPLCLSFSRYLQGEDKRRPLCAMLSTQRNLGREMEI